MSDCTAIAADVARQPHAEILTAEDTVRVIARLHFFREDRVDLLLPAGLSLEEIRARIYGPTRPVGSAVNLVCLIGDQQIYGESWRLCRPKAGTTVIFKPVPKGMRNILGMLVIVAAAVASFYVGGSPALIAELGVTGAAVAGAAAATAVGVLGSLLINALFPVSQPSLETSDQSQIYSISGFQNAADKWGAVPVILGTHRVFPKYGARTYTEIIGNDQYLRALFVWGYGPLDITDIKIGETPIGQYDDVQVEHFYGYPGDGTPTLYPGQVFQTDLSILLSHAAGWQTRTVSNAEIDEISLDFMAPKGILVVDDNGKRFQHSIWIEIQYRLVGAPTWTTWIAGSAGAWYGKTDETQRRGFRTTVTRGVYEVRTRRTSIEYDDGDKVLVLQDLNWTALRGFRNDAPLRFPVPLAITAIRIRATDQLNGVLDDLNGICTSRVTAWSGSAWVTDTPSNNPADLYRWVCQGPANYRPLGDGGMDLAALQSWHASCVTNGFTYNRILDNEQSVYDTLREIAAAGRAAPTSTSGQMGVIFDQPDAPIVQHFTPRNSWDFASARVYKRWPHAFRVRFINEDQGYNEDERLVFDDGYDESNATQFEGLEFPGVTDPDLIWRHGRFHIAQARLRPEFYSLTVDFENLVCTRGDRVRVTHDVPGFGIKAARVRAVSDTLPQTVTLDEVITQNSGGTYAIRFRLADGTSLVRSVTTTEGESNVVRLVGNGDLPEPGDLAMFGEATAETVVLRVYAVQPQSNLTAKLTLVDDAPAISQADQGEIPPFESNITIPPDPFQLPPVDLNVREFVYLSQGGVPMEAAEVSWRVPRRGVIVAFEVQYAEAVNGPWVAAGTVSWPATTHNVTGLDAGTYWFRVRCLFADNKNSSWLTGGPYALNELLTPPPDVTNFKISILGSTATLSWDRVRTPALSHYRLRYSPLTTGVTWGSAVPLLDNINTTSLQLPAQSGTYLIKAVEIGDLESVNATGISTNVSVVAGLNVVETIHEDPYWAGGMDGVQYDPHYDGIRLADFSGLSGSDSAGQTVLSDGYYNFANSVDLGDIFTSRLSARMVAYGLSPSDDFFEVADFFEVDDFFRFDPANWLVSLEVRYTTDDPGSSSAVWSDWETFTQSDYTARAFEFRLYMGTLEEGLTPLVTNLSITVDMPDRVEAGNDLVVTTAGRRIDFDPPFLGFSGVGIAAQDMATGDYYTITGKGVTGFDIIFRDAGGTPIERTFDYVAKGYGRRIDP